MLTQGKIDKFYRDVKYLRLTKPVADITKATGYSKGNVSEFLSGKKQPSENFIDAFYNAFKGKIIEHGSTEVPQSENNINSPNGKIDYIEEAFKQLKETNEYLRRMLDVSLAELASSVNDNAAATRAEIRGYAQRQILKEVNYDDADFLKAKAEADKIYLLNLKQLLKEGSKIDAGM